MVKAKIGVIGLGNMGRGIAQNFVAAGYPVAVWDVAEAAMRPFARKPNVCLTTPAEMAASAAVIFFVVPGSPEIETMMAGRSGMLSAARKGLVLYDLTTSDPARTRLLARKSARKDVSYLDAGMSGGAIGAAAGTLTLMIGGDQAAYKRTRRHLNIIADDLFYLGKSGAGHVMKLIHNMVCHTVFLATCEGGRLAEHAGIELNDMIDVFNVSNARSYASEMRFPKHILSGKWDGRSRVYNLHKDLGMAVAMAKSVGSEVTLGADTFGFLQKAMARGMAEEDFTRLYRDYGAVRKTPARRERKT